MPRTDVTVTPSAPEDLVGLDLGTRRIDYRDSDAILYALAVGVGADEVAHVYEKGLRVLPTFALPLGLWVADAASAAGAFVPTEALHGAQSLVIRTALPSSGAVVISGRVDAVWDTGRSALIDIVAECDEFVATYTIIVPGKGGFGGQRPPRPVGDRNADAVETIGSAKTVTLAQQAALYRLTGDRHAIHIDPEAARAAGFERPILHGLCTLAIAARDAARSVGARPDELCELSARFAAPVTPGDELVTDTTAWVDGESPSYGVAFTTSVLDKTVLADGSAVFGTASR